jgi:hypothetical protein
MTSESIRNWRDLLDRYGDFKSGQWCFRGDRAGRGLKTSLERATIDRWGRDWSEMPDIENGLLRRFKREAHLYVAREPDEDDTIGWLALMRHHGAPTRLHDWTYSFFVAVYFALNRADADEQPCIWAMNLGRIREVVEAKTHLRNLLNDDPNAKKQATVDAIINSSPRHALIFPLNPSKMNQRLILQQSVFIVPGDITKPFMENLEAVDAPDKVVVKMPLPSERKFLQEATKELLAMNMSSATLFPGLDGFGQNLAALIPFPELRAVDTKVGRE